MNTSGYVEYVTICSWMLTIVGILVAGLETGLQLGLDLVYGWSVVMHTYLYYFPLSLYLNHSAQRTKRIRDMTTRYVYLLFTCFILSMQ